METQKKLMKAVDECERESAEVTVRDIVDAGQPDPADQAYDRWRDDMPDMKPAARGDGQEAGDPVPTESGNDWGPFEGAMDWLTGEYTMKKYRGNNSFWW